MKFKKIYGFDLLLKPFLLLTFKFNIKWLLRRIYVVPLELINDSKKNNNNKFLNSIFKIIFLLITFIFAVPIVLIYLLIYSIISLLASLILLFVTIIMGVYYGCLPFLIKLKKQITFSKKKIDKDDYQGYNVLRLPINLFINFLKVTGKKLTYFGILPFKKIVELYDDYEKYNFVEQIYYSFSLVLSFLIYYLFLFSIFMLIGSFLFLLICIVCGSIYVSIHFIHVLFINDDNMKATQDKRKIEKEKNTEEDRIQ